MLCRILFSIAVIISMLLSSISYTASDSTDELPEELNKFYIEKRDYTLLLVPYEPEEGADKSIVIEGGN